MSVDSTSASLGMDARSLDALRGKASRDPKAATRQAAVQFESMFMQMVLKSMRDATPKSEDAGAGNEAFTGLLDQQMAKQFAGRPGGMADMLEKQLGKQMQNLPALSPENTAAQAAAVQAAQQAAIAAQGGQGNVSSIGGNAAGRAEFIQKMTPHAQAAERETGVPASFILGQAALESGWGKGEIRNADGSNSFNLFGIKATSAWKGAQAQTGTTEYENGVAVKQQAKFRSYGSYTEAFSDYARMLANSPRYAGVVKSAGSAEAFAGGMQRAGYATDPQYASKLARTINHTLALQRAMG